jgi:hypothetical protein
MSGCCSVNAKTSSAPLVMVCPVNGARSKQADMLTVKSIVRQLPLGMPDTQYYFCDSSDCEVVYFPLDTQAPLFRRGDLMVRVGSKETVDPIPVCYCFGFTRSDIQNEIVETGSSTITEQIKAEANAGNCACEVKNPSGKCCLGDVARTVKDRLNQKEGRSHDRAQERLL